VELEGGNVGLPQGTTQLKQFAASLVGAYKTGQKILLRNDQRDLIVLDSLVLGDLPKLAELAAVGRDDALELQLLVVLALSEDLFDEPVAILMHCTDVAGHVIDGFALLRRYGCATTRHS